jgi:hypothetical protein
MTARTWQLELENFKKSTRMEQMYWLSSLIFLVSMFARETYEEGTENILNPDVLRRFNELIHRVATYQRKLSSEAQEGLPDDALFDMIQTQLTDLGFAQHVLSRLPLITNN